MELKELKESIEKKSVNLPIVFIAEHDNFIVWQYIHEIAKLKNAEIDVTDIIEDSIFDTEGVIHIVCTDKYEDLPPRNYIIIAKSGNGIMVPKVEEWMLEGFASGKCPGVKNNEIPKFYKNAFRINSELDKISIFPEGMQNEIYELEKSEGAFNDGQMRTAAELANALATFDNNTVKSILINRDNCDLTDMYYIISLRNIFGKLLKIRTLKFPTIVSVGCTSQPQFNFFKITANKYFAKNLLDIYMFICELDYRIRGEGSLTGIDIVNYATTQIMLKRGN